MLPESITRQFRANVERFLPHTYVLTPVRAGPTKDDWNADIPTDQTPVLGQACLYEAVETLRISELGSVIVRTPNLVVMWDDPVRPGDRVSVVTDVNTGEVVATGPFAVEWDEQEGPGGVILRRLGLRNTDVI